ncbi:MAG: transporter substrate-binding domain-containing protein [Coleofasciculus sp. B1-GNL1-01]|uniref:transporter substrate-binding domain-containing protein n=1 Tax=Coleofasciculus sp. B1-GNL1-01 TaxID=3068484 RepID=UPI0033042023
MNIKTVGYWVLSCLTALIVWLVFSFPSTSQPHPSGTVRIVLANGDRGAVVSLANSTRERSRNNSDPTPPLNDTSLSSTLRVITKVFEPFVIYDNGNYSGFSIELWDKLAEKMGVSYQLQGVDTIGQLLEEIEQEMADVAIAGVTITSEREETIDFSYPYFESGLQIMVSAQNRSLLGTLFQGTLSILLTPALYYAIGFFVLCLLIAAHLIWFVERQHNEEFPKSYLPGIWESFWWAAVTVTTVGYGDKTPKKALGRLFALFWMCAGYFIFAYFTASITTSFTLQGLRGAIATPADLHHVRVATVEKSAAQEYLQDNRVASILFKTLPEAYQALEDERVDAVVYDAPALQNYATSEGQGMVKLIEPTFQQQNYGIALPEGSLWREKINLTLLKLMEDGTYQGLYQEWFGMSTQ